MEIYSSDIYHTPSAPVKFPDLGHISIKNREIKIKPKSYSSMLYAEPLACRGMPKLMKERGSKHEQQKSNDSVCVHFVTECQQVFCRQEKYSIKCKCHKNHGNHYIFIEKQFEGIRKPVNIPCRQDLLLIQELFYATFIFLHWGYVFLYGITYLFYCISVIVITQECFYCLVFRTIFFQCCYKICHNHTSLIVLSPASNEVSRLIRCRRKCLDMNIFVFFHLLIFLSFCLKYRAIYRAIHIIPVFLGLLSKVNRQVLPILSAD